MRIERRAPGKRPLCGRFANAYASRCRTQKIFHQFDPTKSTDVVGEKISQFVVDFRLLRSIVGSQDRSAPHTLMSYRMPRGNDVATNLEANPGRPTHAQSFHCE
jgi:hypothetical protein